MTAQAWSPGKPEGVTFGGAILLVRGADEEACREAAKTKGEEASREPA
jgi:hypothetical protein